MAEADNIPKLNDTFSDEKDISSKNDETSLKSKHILRKRQFSGLNRTGSKNVFVNSKTHFKAQLRKCEKLFDNGAIEVILHGLGAAVYKASSLALQLKEIHHESLDLDIKTSTVALIDDLEPLNDDMDYDVNNRQNSAIHIRVFRKIPLGVLKYAD